MNRKQNIPLIPKCLTKVKLYDALHQSIRFDLLTERRKAAIRSGIFRVVRPLEVFLHRLARGIHRIRQPLHLSGSRQYNRPGIPAVSIEFRGIRINRQLVECFTYRFQLCFQMNVRKDVCQLELDVSFLPKYILITAVQRTSSPIKPSYSKGQGSMYLKKTVSSSFTPSPEELWYINLYSIKIVRLVESVGKGNVTRRASSFLVLLAAVLWGTTGTAQAFAPESAHPMAVGAMRLAIGGGALLLFVLMRGKLRKGKGWPVAPTAVAAASMAAYQPLFFSAVATTGVAVGTVVAIGSAPVLAGLLEYIFGGKKPEHKWWISTSLAIGGCVVLFTHPHDTHLVTPTGVAMAVGAGLSFAVYTFVSKQLINGHAPEAVTALVFSLAALFLSPVLFMYPLHWLAETAGWAVALHLGLCATALAYLLFSKGLTGVPAANAVTLALGEPLTAAVLGIVLVGEVLPPFAWLGVGLLLVGLGVLSHPSK